MAGGVEVCKMAGRETKWGPVGSLIDKYMTDRHSLIKKMQRDGWDVSQTLEQQRKWVDGEKRDKTKKAGVLLVHQLAGLIEQVVASTKKWNEDKDKIKKLESRVRELEKRNRVLEENQWGGETVPLPPYESTQQGPTAPPEEGEAREHNLAPVTWGRTDAQPTANYKLFTPGERQQIMASLGKL